MGNKLKGIDPQYMDNSYEKLMGFAGIGTLQY